MFTALTKPEIQRAAVDGVPGGSNRSAEESTGQTLRHAAKIIEKAAYDAAGAQQPAVISQLIIIAAELERLAQVIEKSAPKA